MQQVGTGPSTEGWDQKAELEKFCRMVCDARELLDFAVSEWPMVLKRQGKAAPEIDNAIKNRIYEAENFARQSCLPPKDERAAFEDSYFDLCTLLAPINVRTVRATSDKGADNGELCEARCLARRLWWWTGVFIAMVAVGEIAFRVYKWPPDFNTDFWGLVLYWFAKFLFPFAYGGVGACAYLLRSGVGFIGSREFDPNFAPEYTNRIWLGVLTGGIAYHLLKELEFVQTMQLPIRQVTEALFGFFGGYFNDRVFRAFERIVDAILPGVTLKIAETLEKPPAATAPRLPADRLVELLKEAESPEDKKMIASLLDRIAKRRTP